MNYLPFVPHLKTYGQLPFYGPPPPPRENKLKTPKQDTRTKQEKIKDVSVSSNYAILKKYGDSFYKLTTFKSALRFLPKQVSKLPLPDKIKKGTINEVKLRENISRARAKVFELITCNQWKYWSTFTLDKKKYQRDDLVKFQKDFSQWIRDQGKKLGVKLDYILVPELHKDKLNWHMHGFIQGLPVSELTQFTEQTAPTSFLRKQIHNGAIIFNWDSYGAKFGFNDLELIRSQEACSKYIAKYFTKELSRSVGVLGAHMFYSSKGLNKSLEIKRGTIIKQIVPKYENDYVRVAEFSCKEHSLAELEEYIESPDQNKKELVYPLEKHDKPKYEFKPFDEKQFNSDVIFSCFINDLPIPKHLELKIDYITQPTLF